MSNYSHTFYYDDEAELIAQLDEMLAKLTKSDMEPHAVVRGRYPHLTSSAFTMRLKRFKGEFPHEKGNRKITRLFVTRALDACLRKGSTPSPSESSPKAFGVKNYA